MVLAGCLTISIPSVADSSDWEWLFHGKKDDLKNWEPKPRYARKPNAQPAPITGEWKVENGDLVHIPSGGYLRTKEQYANFILELEVKLTPGANSGIYIWSPEHDTMNRGLEFQILDSFGTPPDKHSFGAFYDCVAPTENTSKPVDEWQHMRIQVQNPRIQVSINHTLVVDVNIDDWTQAGLNPDGTENKYAQALGSRPRKGRISIQDHKSKLRFRNIRVKRLPDSH
jgi:hypothetical protein